VPWGFIRALHPLKHLLSLSSPITLEKDLKIAFLALVKIADCSLLGYLSLGALKEKRNSFLYVPSMYFSFILFYC